MNQFIASLLLAAIQGFSEWLPISSSGHLVLFSKIFGFDNSVAFDVVLHFGTLMAVFVYFGRDIVNIIDDYLNGRWKSENAKLGYLLLISSVPAAIIGFLFKEYFELAFESLAIVAIGLGITSLLLFISSLNFKINRKKMPKQSDAWLIGLAQAVAIFPGVSRSGSTISAGLLRGLDDKMAVKFSFLMSIPVIFGASILEIGSERLPSSYIFPALVSFVFGLAAIHFLLKVVVNNMKSLRWFALYCLLLAMGIGAWLIFG